MPRPLARTLNPTTPPMSLIVTRRGRADYDPIADLDITQAEYEAAEKAYTIATTRRRHAARNAHTRGGLGWLEIGEHLGAVTRVRAREIAFPRESTYNPKPPPKKRSTKR